MDLINEFLAWACMRHHNLLSWYIRPLFLIPFCYFAYRRSWKGIAFTLIALATSIFWFPAPQNPDPIVLDFLAAEQDFLSGPFTLVKVLQMSLIPFSLSLLAFAFWKRSIWLGLALINLIAITKQVWSVLYGGESGWAVLPPMLIGLVLCNLLVYWLIKRHPSKNPPSVASGSSN